MLSKAIGRASLLLGNLKSCSHTSYMATPSALLGNTQTFSTFFKELDKASHERMRWEFYKVKQYSMIDQGWRLPLARKKAKRATQKAREQEVGVPEPQKPILYVHD